MKSIFKLKILVAALAVAGGSQAGELPDTRSMSGLQFNFSPPGARSLGMGGAFLGRADDATAAFANPAGLTNLFSTEISAEYRQMDFSTPYTTSGTYPNEGRSTASSDTNNLSYLSLVVPREKWVFALYRQQYVDFNTAFKGGIVDFPGGSAFPTDNSIDAEIVNYGFSMAFRASDRFSIGASVTYLDYDMSGLTIRYDTIDPSREVSRQVQSGSDDSWGFNIGGLFQATDRFSIGLVYRSAYKFNTFHQNIAQDPGGSGDSTVIFQRAFDFEVPDMYGIGFSFQPNDNFTINLDINRINYSKLSSPAFWAFTANPTPEQKAAVDKLFIDDGTEYRLGAEYVFSNVKLPFALRAGVWQDPAHTLAFAGPPNPPDEIQQQFHDSFFQGTDDETHIAFGFGLFWSKFQLDLAADLSDLQDTYSVSGVFRFD